MQHANVRIKISPEGSDIPLNGVTPAELLIHVHGTHGFIGKANGFPVLSFELLKDEPKELAFNDEEGIWKSTKDNRSKTGELARLKRKFRKEVFNDVYPGASPNMPEKFEDVPGMKEAFPDSFKSVETKKA